MKTPLVVVAALVTLSSAAAAEPACQAGVRTIVSASCAVRPSTRLGAIVYPDGGGLEADPDIGQLALKPAAPGAPAVVRRH